MRISDWSSDVCSSDLIAGYNAVIPRIGASITRYGNAVLHQFELMGSFTPNPSAAIMRARDKLRSHQLLAAQGIGLPVTVFGDNPDDTGDLLAMLGPPRSEEHTLNSSH